MIDQNAGGNERTDVNGQCNVCSGQSRRWLFQW